MGRGRGLYHRQAQGGEVRDPGFGGGEGGEVVAHAGGLVGPLVAEEVRPEKDGLEGGEEEGELAGAAVLLGAAVGAVELPPLHGVEPAGDLGQRVGNCKRWDVGVEGAERRTRGNLRVIMM